MTQINLIRILILVALGVGGLATGHRAFAELPPGSQIDSDGIIRHEDGTIHFMTQLEAVTACPKGMHLPTIREFVILAQALGSWVFETTEMGPDQDPYTFILYSVTHPDGTKDTFWYSFLNYYNGRKFPKSDLVNNWFWSSSIDQERTDLALDFRGFMGSLGYGYRDRDTRAVRCLAD